MWVIGICLYICDRVHDNDTVLLSLLAYHIFHHGQFLGKSSWYFYWLWTLTWKVRIQTSSSDPRQYKWVLIVLLLKQLEFSSFYFWLHKTVWFMEERGLESAGILWISNISEFTCWRGTNKVKGKLKRSRFLLCWEGDESQLDSSYWHAFTRVWWHFKE